MSGDELDAMRAIKDALEGLDTDTQELVVWWAIKRFNLSIKAETSKSAKGSVRQDDDPDDDDKMPPEFETFGEFFAYADPTTDVQKALVAAYWVQEVEGNPQWGALPLSAALKNLGHSLNNISRALTHNMEQKPQLIVQLKKSGNTQQAKKTYKVTEAGKTAVKAMLANGSS